MIEAKLEYKYKCSHCQRGADVSEFAVLSLRPIRFVQEIPQVAHDEYAKRPDELFWNRRADLYLLCKTCSTLLMAWICTRSMDGFVIQDILNQGLNRDVWDGKK